MKRYTFYGELYTFPIFSKLWKKIIMHFITDLFSNKRGKRVYDTILIMVDKYTKMVRYSFANKTINAIQLLRPEFNRKVCRERLPKQTGQNVQVEHGNVWHVGNVQTCLFLFIYICRYFANKQLFSSAVNIFIYWIHNVMFNPIYHHCFPFTGFYKKFTCAEFKPLLIVRQVRQPYLLGGLSVGCSRWFQPTP